MSLAFILLKCDQRLEKEVLKEIGQINEVKETHETFGSYDAVVKIETSSPKQVKQIFNEKILDLRGINSTLTLLEDY
ncbi:MAG: Lrp/AsnC ligand binding domain-containing protein [Nitrosopumilus sp.]|nr:Lrp/AsnC ligand binding domain-containing protein [Nitrosopumilus sp.]